MFGVLQRHFRKNMFSYNSNSRPQGQFCEQNDHVVGNYWQRYNHEFQGNP